MTDDIRKIVREEIRTILAYNGQRDEQGRPLYSLKPEEPKVTLPTEPGWYLGKYAGSPSGVITVELLGTGEWVDNTDSRYLNKSFIEELRDITRLEPVAETAKKVLGNLDAASMLIRKGRDSAHRVIYDDYWDNIATKYGVQS